MAKIEIVEGYDRPQEVAELFNEYTQYLVDNDREFAEYLKIQHYDDEVADLGSKYGRPGGRLWLAYVDGKLAGCSALRRMSDENCEFKRLYVRPAFRGLRLGRQLMEKIIADAKDVGYEYGYLDTLPFLKAACRMYEEMGFEIIPAYNDSPLASTIFMRLKLR